MKNLLKFCPFFVFFFSFSAYGQSWQVTQTGGSTNNDKGNKIRIDHLGNYIVHGCATMGADIGGTIFNYEANFVAKYDNTGNLQWVIPAGDQDSALVFLSVTPTVGGIEIDNAGNIFVFGSFDSTGLIGDSTITGIPGARNVFISKIDPSGIVLWNKYVTDNTIPTDIALDSSGNILICGFTEGISTFDNVVIDPFGFQNERDIVFAKYDSSGNFIWVRQCGGGDTGYSDRAFGIACDNSDNLVLVGQIRSSASFGGLQLNAINPITSFNGFICKFDSAGNALWVDYCGYTSNNVTISADGDIYPVGYANGGATSGFDSLVTFGTNNNAFLAKLDPAGNYIWAKVNSGDGFVNAYDVAVDTYENCYITGTFNDTIYFDSHQLIAPSSTVTFQSMYIAVFNNSGNAKWVHAIGGALGSRTLGHGVDAIDSCNYAVIGTFLSPPAVIHTDTLISFGSYDFYFTANIDSCLGSTTSLNEPGTAIQNVNLFPNPATSEITIETFSENNRIEFFDISGRLVFENVTHKNLVTIPLMEWNDGLYLVRIIDLQNNTIKISRFIKCEHC